MRLRSWTAVSRAVLACPALAGAIALPLLALSACKEAAVVAPPPDVVVADVVQKDVPIYLEWVGTTDGNVNAQIRARVNGYLQERNYTEGNARPRGRPAVPDRSRGRTRPRSTRPRASSAGRRPRSRRPSRTSRATRRWPSEGAVSQQELDNAVQAQPRRQGGRRYGARGARAGTARSRLDARDVADHRHRRHRASRRSAI